MGILFSPRCRTLVKESRLVAVELGYDYITSLHFMLADCRLGRADSILPFIFRSQAQYQQYFESLRVDESTILAESLPLTREAENMIRGANDLVRKSGHTLVLPRHFFLCAITMPQSAFYRSLKDTGDLPQKLGAFYNGIPIDEFAPPVVPGFFKKLFSRK